MNRAVGCVSCRETAGTYFQRGPLGESENGAASSRGYALCDTSLGETGYQSVVADYDGDGLADPAVYNRTTGLWSIGYSSIGYQLATWTFGGSGYLPATADYDGDGLADPAVMSQTSNEWIVMFSSGNYTPVPLTLSFE